MFRSKIPVFVQPLIKGGICAAVEDQGGNPDHGPHPGQPSVHGTERVLFAGGCFWCMEAPFARQVGVLSVRSGYAGGTTDNPTYATYHAGGHLEVVEVIYDPLRVSFQRLLDIYWRQIDPTDSGGQFVDRGHGYTTAIFCDNDEQQRLAEVSKKALDAEGRFSRPVVTPVLRAGRFYPAEDYHQEFHVHNPLRYSMYRAGSGRDAFLEKIWGKE